MKPELSGVAIMCENLLRLYQMTQDPRFLSSTEGCLKRAFRYIDSYSLGYIYHVMNISYYYDKTLPSIVIVLNEKEELKEKLQSLLFERHLLHTSIIWKKQNDVVLESFFPYLKHFVPIDGETSLYICYKGVCKQPQVLWNEMVHAIQNL